jgi:putative spermidine/putrescine transport system substrate-binding protein
MSDEDGKVAPQLGPDPIVLGLLGLSCLMGLVSVVTNFTQDVTVCPDTSCPAAVLNCPAPLDAAALTEPLETGIDAIMTMTETDYGATWEPLDLPDPFSGLEWSELSYRARGTNVSFHMWSGNTRINDWVDGWLADRLKTVYDINLVRVPVTYANGIMNVVTEHAAAHTTEVQDTLAALQDVTSGTCDIVWINGANFRRMREDDTLFGPFATALPSKAYYDYSSEAVAYDFGYPTNGYEVPYNTAQVVFIYNKAHIPAQPPMTIPELVTWVSANPGKFKYSAPPSHFTGSVIVRHFFYHFAGEGLGGVASWTDFNGDFDEALYLARAPAVWAALNDLEPYLHGYDAANTDNPCGACYPDDHEVVNSLFADGSITFEVSYNVNEAANQIMAGTWPVTSQVYVLSSGTIANTNFTAGPHLSPRPTLSADG